MEITCRKTFIFYLLIICGMVPHRVGAELRLTPVASIYDGDRQDVCFSGDTVFVASAMGVEFFCLAVPTGLTRCGQLIYPAGVRRVACLGSVLAFATNNDSLLIYDLSQSDHPGYIAGFAAGGTIGQLEAYRNHLYFSDDQGWWRINLGDPFNPVLDFSQTTPAPITAFSFFGDSLFIAGSDGLTMVYQIDGTPQPVGVFPSRPNISSMVVDHRWVYAAAGDSGVFIYDLRKPPAEMEIGRFNTYGHAYEVILVDTLLGVADSLRGCMVLGLADPARPYLLGSNNQPRALRSIDPQGSIVAAVAVNGVFLIDLAIPFIPQVVGHTGGDYRVADLADGDDVLAAAVGGAGLALIDITSPAGPTILSQTNFVDEIFGLDLAGDLAALAAGDDGLLLIDITDRGNPRQVFGEQTYGFALDVAIDDSLAIVADGTGGFRVFEIFDPAAAHLIGGKLTAAAVTAVARRGNYVFVIDPELGWEVYDISFAFKPKRTFRYPPDGLTRDLHLHHNRAWLAVDSLGLLVFDISTPSSPVKVAELDLIKHPRRVMGDHDLLFVLDDSAGVVMIDYGIPEVATIISTVPLSDPATSIVHNGDNLFVAGERYLLSLVIEPPLIPGDLNEDGILSVIDVVYLVNYLYRGGPPPGRSATAELNGDGRLNLADLVLLVQLVFY